MKRRQLIFASFLILLVVSTGIGAYLWTQTQIAGNDYCLEVLEASDGIVNIMEMLEPVEKDDFWIELVQLRVMDSISSELRSNLRNLKVKLLLAPQYSPVLVSVVEGISSDKGPLNITKAAAVLEQLKGTCSSETWLWADWVNQALAPLSRTARATTNARFVSSVVNWKIQIDKLQPVAQAAREQYFLDAKRICHARGSVERMAQLAAFFESKCRKPANERNQRCMSVDGNRLKDLRATEETLLKENEEKFISKWNAIRLANLRCQGDKD